MATPLLITLDHRGRSVDLDIRVDGPALVGDLVDALVRQAELVGAPRKASLAVHRTGQTLAREERLSDADLRAGDRCRLSDAPKATERAKLSPAAVAEIVEGPDVGRVFEMRPGPSDIGRSEVCEVRIEDRLASRRHARIDVGDDIRVHDLGSTNGVLVNGEAITGVVKISSDDLLMVGETSLRIRAAEAVDSHSAGPVVRFNRPPHVFRPFEGREVKLPAPPGDPPKNRFSITPALAPLVMGLGMYLILGNAYFMLFMLLSPVMVVGSYVENRAWNRRDYAEQLEEHSELLGRVIAALDADREKEIASRRHEFPSASEAVEFVLGLSPRLWERHADEQGFLTLRVGRAEQDSRTTVVLDSGGSRKLRDEMEDIPTRYARIPDLPAVASLVEMGGIGVAGPIEQANAVARALMLQLTGLHAPSDVVLAALLGEVEAAAWHWLGWLPHVRSSVSPVTGSHFGTDAHSCAVLLRELLDEMERRTSEAGTYGNSGVPSPAVVILIDEGAPLDRTRLLPLLEAGPPLGLYFIWIGSSRVRLPRACGAVLDLQSRSGDVTVGYRETGEEIAAVETEVTTEVEAEQFARALSPVVEVGGRLGTAASVPTRVNLVELLGGVQIMDDPETVLDRWRQGDDLLQQGKTLRLRAPLGRQVEAPLSVDIRTDGPHALVAGTTGSGKSELLQSYVASLAATHSPRHMTFLLVDYKGGAAFKDCVHLPHTVGLVTDLNASEVRRALVSLEAELRYRERILNEAGAKDLIELERTEHPKTPPTLVVIVDEFAALIREVPEFIEGVVDVALRGRSLGIHLLLATQRPTGVVTPQIRANTSLRIALRVADDDDSIDVIGTKDAAALPSEVPGRAIARLGPRGSTLFQSAYVGGSTQAATTGPRITVSRVSFDRSTPLAAAEAASPSLSPDGATDLQRLVDNIQSAHEMVGLEAPRRPWHPPLASVYDLARLPQAETDAEIVLGVVDMPRQQRQTVSHFKPDQEGNILVLGASGSGKTVLLRTLAASAGMSKSGATTHVYGLDFAGRGLEMLRDLPHVGTIVPGHDIQRVVRLLRDLRARIDERSAWFAAVRAGSLPEYRASPRGEPNEPRVVVLLDGYSAFHSALERVEGGKWVDCLTQLVGDGRQFGVHFVMTADRRSAFPLALTGAVGSRIVLRLAHSDEYAAAGVPTDMISATSSPGRAVFNGLELQIALLGGDVSGDAQNQAMAELAEYVGSRPHMPAPSVRVLSDDVALESLARDKERFVVGVREADLGPAMLPFSPGGFVVTGPPRSGKTTALDTLIAAAPPKVKGVVIVALRASRLTASRPNCRVAVGEDSGTQLLRSVLEGPEEDMLVVVDDLHDFVHTKVAHAVSDVLREAHDRRWMVSASADSGAARRAYDGALRDARGSRSGLLLQPDSELDGDIVGIRLPRVTTAMWPPGRGYLVIGGIHDLCQVGVAE